MKYCPITYEPIEDNESYSQQGLKLLSPQLKNLAPLEYDAAEQRMEAAARVGKMSVQGVQTKLSAQLKVKEGRFELVDQHGHYILKPQSEYYPQLPENEAITMFLAGMVHIDVPPHGLVYSKDGSMTYFVKRFDRFGHHKKLAMEDFAQLSQKSRDTKYNSSMEKVASIMMQYCSFPQIEAVKLFRLTVFNFLIGNEDMHLKNFSLITQGPKVLLSPAYDLLNTTIAQGNAKEELALPLHGKKNNLQNRDFINYFAHDQLRLNNTIVQEVLDEIHQALPTWEMYLERSYLSSAMREKYLNLLQDRARIFF